MATAAPRKDEKGKETPQTRNFATKKWVRLQVEIYQKLRQTWLRHIMAQKKKAKRPRKPAVLRPKSELGKLPQTAVSARGTSEKGSLRSANCQSPGHCKKAKVGEEENNHKRLLLSEPGV